MAKFIVSGRGGPFYDGHAMWPVGSTVEIREEDYPRLLSESFDPADTEAADALLKFHNDTHADRNETKPPKDPGRLDALNRAKQRIPVQQEQQEAHDKADAEEQAARQEADNAAARNPDRKSAADAKRKAYAEAAAAKADAYKAADDRANEALSDQGQAPATPTSVPPAQPGAPASESPIATAPGPNVAQITPAGTAPAPVNQTVGGNPPPSGVDTNPTGTAGAAPASPQPGQPAGSGTPAGSATPVVTPK